MIWQEKQMEPYLMSEQELQKHNDLYDKADALVEEKLNANTGKKRKEIRFTFKGFLLNLAVMCCVMTLVVYGVSKYSTLYPYAVTANNEVLCYVDGKASANEAVQKAVEALKADGSDVISVSVGDSFNVEKAEDINVDKVISADEAADLIVQNARENESGDGIRVVSSDVETRTFMPDPQYEKDETALAGTTVVKEEGAEGKKEVTVTYVTVNGDVEKKEDIEVKMLDEGKSAVIVKGTLGLPDGEAWETYEGDPVYNDGDDLAVTATGYAGKLNYVLGGHNIATGVDCVGFVREMYRLYGVNLSSHLQSEGIGVSYSNAQPGDILCFSHHYGIYLGNGKMVHAANPKADVCVSGVGAGGKLIGVRRIVTR